MKPACGVIGGAFGVTAAVAFTEQFPEYDGAYPSVRAAAHVTESDGTLTITAVLSGLGEGMTGGWHIHRASVTTPAATTSRASTMTLGAARARRGHQTAPAWPT